MAKLKQAVAVLEQRRGLGYLPTERSDRYRNAAQTDQETQEKFIVYQEEMALGKTTPMTSAFNSKPFDTFKDAWNGARQYGVNIYDKLKNQNKKAGNQGLTYDIQENDTKKVDDAFIIILGFTRGTKPKVAKDYKYYLKLYIKKTAYHSVGDRQLGSDFERGYIDKNTGNKVDFNVHLYNRDGYYGPKEGYPADSLKQASALGRRLLSTLSSVLTNGSIAPKPISEYNYGLPEVSAAWMLNTPTGDFLALIDGFEPNPGLAKNIDYPKQNFSREEKYIKSLEDAARKK